MVSSILELRTQNISSYRSLHLVARNWQPNQSINEINFHRLAFWHASIMADEYKMDKIILSILPLQMTGINELLI